MAEPETPQPEIPSSFDAMPPPDTPNYHISVWDEPPTYVCLRCTAVGMTLPEVSLHVQVEHGEQPAPTPLIPGLLKMRADSAAPETQDAPATTDMPPPAEEEPRHG